MMRGLAASDILDVWEWGNSRHTIDRALLILAAAVPGTPPERLSALTIGQRDAGLLAVHAETFGSGIAGFDRCPSCSAELEFSISKDELDLSANADGDNLPFTVEIDHFQLKLRCPDSRDLAASAVCADVPAARRLLLERVVVEARQQGKDVAAADLPDAIADAVSDRLAEQDPQADIRIALVCPDCGHAWDSVLDVATFLWTEVSASARRLLSEVHTLARAYGWREADILAIGPARRQAYLQMAGSPWPTS